MKFVLPIIEKLGHISKTHKMPCYSWSLSAFDCIATDPICMKICYAKRHHYNFSNVKEALHKNKTAYLDRNWVRNFKKFLLQTDTKFFRWFDSGDLPNILLLEKICKIADNNKQVKFWLPTRMKGILTNYYEANNRIKLSKLHKNLIIRFSASDVDTDPDYDFAKKLGLVTSSIRKKFNCRAKANKGQCGSCRMCWNPKVKEVSYYLH